MTDDQTADLIGLINDPVPMYDSSLSAVEKETTTSLFLRKNESSLAAYNHGHRHEKIQWSQVECFE